MKISEEHWRRVYWSAVAVANAIHVGAGGLIQGSLMEQEFRDALRLQPGEIPAIPDTTE